MRTSPYKDFSLKFHKKNRKNKKSNLCHFELTFGCALHCKHCYSDCYNSVRYLKKELDTKGVKIILDKIYARGALWLCFTGGDPLTRRDFLELYAYAKDKGFIVTIFTNAYSMSKKIADYLMMRPPFVIELTLNAATQDLYEKIAQVKDSFSKVMKGIDLILKAKLPLKIKTQVTKDNLEELPKIKKFVESLGLKFRPSVLLQSRLDGDLTPANLRISPQEVLNLNGNKKAPVDDCGLLPITDYGLAITKIFSCAITGGGGIHIDPYGNLVPCNCIRSPKLNLLKENMDKAQQKILNWVRTRYFTNSSICQRCSIRSICYNCPGRVLLETGNLEGKIDWFCKLARDTVNLK